MDGMHVVFRVIAKKLAEAAPIVKNRMKNAPALIPIPKNGRCSPPLF
jgi:hypothetical protein